MRKILVVTSHHPSRRHPLQAVYGYYTYQALATRCAIRFIAPRPWWTRVRSPSELLHAPRERWGTLDIDYPSYFSVPGLAPLHGLGMAASLARRVTRVRREFPFELILSAWAYPDATAAALLAARHRVPLVVTVLGSDVNALARMRGLRSQIRHALASAARVVAVSEALAAELQAIGIPAERIVVQHNGVDGEAFAPHDRAAARAKLGLPAGAAIVGYVGRLSHEKGPDVLVEAAARSAAAPAPRFVIIGAGPEERALRERAAALRVADRVLFVGHRGHRELPDWLAAFDVLCLPSRREGCPNVVLEALASGRPVLASRVGGVPELLRGDNGVLVAPDDPGALARAVDEVLQRAWDPAALRATVPALSWDAVGATYARVLEEVLMAAPRPDDLGRQRGAMS